MDDEVRLLGRLGAGAARAGAPAEVASIVAHLRALLSTRAGSSLLDDSYGLPDLTDLAHATTPRGVELAHLVATCVRRHEPRLRDVTVRPALASSPASNTLGFTLSARCEGGEPLHLDGHIAAGGRLTLHPRTP